MLSSLARTESSPIGTSDHRSWIRVSLRSFQFRISLAIPRITRPFLQQGRKSSRTCSCLARISFAVLAKRREIQESGPAFTTKWTISPASSSGNPSLTFSLPELRTTAHSNKRLGCRKTAGQEIVHPSRPAAYGRCLVLRSASTTAHSVSQPSMNSVAKCLLVPRMTTADDICAPLLI